MQLNDMEDMPTQEKVPTGRKKRGFKSLVGSVPAAVGWRLHRLLGDRLVYGSLLASARLIRRAVGAPVYIGVTGSAGKTTTKEILYGMLSVAGKGAVNRASYSNVEEIAKAMLRLRPSSKFFATELSGDHPGAMTRTLGLLRPSIGIVTVVRDDHTSAEYTKVDVAREKSRLVACLPVTGTAVLNADDELVAAMAGLCKGQVITFGLAPQASLRATSVRSEWPGRLELTVSYRNEEVRVLTRLCGTHWLPSVLGAIGGGLAFGMSLEECAYALAQIEPYTGRMQPVEAPGGLTFIRDDFKAPLWTVDASLAFMRDARASRKIVVFGSLSDCGSQVSGKYLATAVKAQAVADHIVFVGPWAFSALNAPTAEGRATVHAFSHVRDAVHHLESLLQAGDLILLKGTNSQEHLERILLAGTSGVACWRDDCQLSIFCSECPRLGVAAGTGYTDPLAEDEISTDEKRRSVYPVLSAGAQVIVGLGNPGEAYIDTPHNVGYEAVNLLAERLQCQWLETDEASLAIGERQGQQICLLKVASPMNLIGVGLKRLADIMEFGPENCILVFDDLNLTFGNVRSRQGGSAGGHRGVASVLQAFQSNQLRRVKIGIKQKEGEVAGIDYVLAVFSEEDKAQAAAAVDLAASRALEVIDRRAMATTQ